jgi:DNA-binding CsgD family transcriptional regulator
LIVAPIVPAIFRIGRSMTIRQDILGGLGTTIARRARRSGGFMLPPVAIPDLGSAAAALIAGRKGLEPAAAAICPAPSAFWARAASAALGVLGLPAAVLSSSHRLAAANGLMERLIPRVVQDRPSRLGLADRRADAMLGEALQEMHTGGGCVRAVPLAATRHLPASVLHVFPVQNTADAGDASCILVVAAVARPQIASAQILQDLFDLTPAEARVARGIAAGKTIRDIAGEAGLAYGTVRQQLKSVFGKTGVSRQADLVGLLVGGALGFPGKAPSGGLV